ncbi:MAG: hypothetical protein KQI78_06765 [Deltaproteobacteria bacterium]|nr:hypothetical protein [Deltaproteobacteria bacterium]
MHKYVFMKTILTICIVLFFSNAQAADYFISKNGNDSNPGKFESPWQTLDKANKILKAGDSVYIREGTYTLNGTAISPVNSGSKDNIICFSSYNDEKVIFVNTSTSTSATAVNLDSDSGTIRSYIKVTGLTFIDFNRHLWILKGHHNEISYCKFSGTALDGTKVGWRGSTIYRAAKYNHIHHNIFTNYGGYSPNDNGVVFELGNETASDDGTSYNIIENNELSNGGHHVFGMNGNHNVIRNNYIHNEPFYKFNGILYGNRVTFMVGHDGDDERNLIEGNSIAYGSRCADDEIGGSGGTIASRRHIIRKNKYYQNGIYASVFKVYTGQGSCTDNHVYSNVYWYNGHDLSETEKTYFNNEYTHAIYITESNLVQNNIFKNNIFYNNKNYYGKSIPIIESYPERDQPDLQIISGNWMEFGDPHFKNISGIPSPNLAKQYDFELQSDSGAIDNGVFLTKITSTSGSGTVFTVEDAGYFFDGWGLADEITTTNISGDIIQLKGQSQTARILGVNYDNNTIFLDSPLTWTKGQEVALEYGGTAPDQGAYEVMQGTTGLFIPETPENPQILLDD